MEPKVSVIIPAYNTEAYIGQAIQSVLDQTEPRFEIVVVDDASSDGTVEVVKGFTDERIRLYVNEENRGANNARNRALDEATGEWIALLDSDDWYAPERLEHLLQAANRFDADMVADDLYMVPSGSTIDAERERYRDRHGTEHEIKKVFSEDMKRSLPRQLSAAEFVLGNLTGPDNKLLGYIQPLFRAAFLEANDLRYDEDVWCSQDTVFFTKCLIHDARLILIPQPYYYVRRGRAGAISNTGDPVQKARHRYEVNSRFLQHERCKRDPELKRALLLRNRGLKRMMHYYPFKQFVHAHSRREVWREIVRNPYGFFVFLLWREPWTRWTDRITHALEHMS